METFNKEDVYDAEIGPLMTKIIDICNGHKIPMLASFTYESCEEKGIGHCTTLLNGFENRKDDDLQHANKIIRSGGHQTFAIAITKES